jgi:hypothetical protein
MTTEIKDDNSVDHIEKTILRQILGVSLMSLLVYLINSAFIVKSSEVFVQSFIVFLFYLSLLIWTFFSGHFILKKRVITYIIFASVLAGFFVIGGLKGLSVFDIANMFFFISIMYKGREKDYYLVGLFVTLLGLCVIQLSLPHMITNKAASDPEWIVILNILFRILLAINIVVALRNAYSAEHDKVIKLLQKVNTLNIDITAQNEELKSMQEELRSNNEKLEILVHERTQKLELQNEALIMYAYLNSHVFRGPVCRIQGILNLLEIEKDEQVKKDLQSYLFSEVNEIDKVIKDISNLLYEADAEVLEEIRFKAKKLYNF